VPQNCLCNVLSCLSRSCVVGEGGSHVQRVSVVDLISIGAL
jgi:hypothetical protein